MSDADRFKYDTLFLEDHSTSINWHKRRRMVSASDALIASINTNTCTTLSIHAGPFILDFGATIHISPDTFDFFELKPIPPRTIKGIGSSSINATRICRIRLCIGKGLWSQSSLCQRRLFDSSQSLSSVLDPRNSFPISTETAVGSRIPPGLLSPLGRFPRWGNDSTHPA